MNMAKCKYAKKVKGTTYGANGTYCACTSPKAEVRGQYIGITKLYDIPTMGVSTALKKPGNWWSLCIDGKAVDTGVTPSRCDYYL